MDAFREFWKEHTDPKSWGLWAILLAMATMLGAFGGFPKPPRQFLRLAQFPIVQWLLVFVLIYQGGAGENPIMAAALTIITFILYQVLKALEPKEDDEPAPLTVDEKLALAAKEET